MTDTFHPQPDWQTWRPNQRATLMFFQRAGEVLLIRKKRGLGAGKITAPGGKLEPMETAMACAIRETAEEVGLMVSEAGQIARLKYQFTDGLALQVEVFTSHAATGRLRETSEGTPLWFPKTELPYQEMWADDIFWLPRAFAGERLCGHFLFEDDRILSHDIHAVNAAVLEDPDAY